VTDPGGIGAELRAELHRHFTRAQIEELVLDMASWSQQKIQVCLGLDADAPPPGSVDFDFDERGSAVISR